MRGLRFWQASLLVPLYRRAPVGSRALPLRFEDAPAVKRPRRNAGPEQWDGYRQLVQRCNLSRRFTQMMGALRQMLDAAGAARQILVLAADGSFCNRRVFSAPRDRTEIIARARQDETLPWLI